VVRGLAPMGDRLYVLHMRQYDQLDELDAKELRLRRRLPVPAEWQNEWRHLSDMASCQHLGTHTHTHTHNRLTAFCPGLPG